MLWLFLFISFCIGGSVDSLPAAGNLRQHAIVRALVRSADSIRVGTAYPGKAGLYAVRISRRYRLGERKVIMSDVASVAFPGNGNFFAVARQVSGIVLYDTTGRQVRAISRWGSRRLEYDRPQIARAYGDTVAVWDGGNLKYLYFDGDGEVIGEISGFTWETVDFLFGKGRIVGYRAGDIQEEFLYDYDAVKDRIMLSGERDGVHRFGLERKDQHVLAGDPDRYVYLVSGSCRLRLVELGKVTREVDVCRANSSPLSVHHLENHFIVVLIAGRSTPGVPDESSHLRMEVLDHRLRSLDTIDLPVEVSASIGSNVVGSHGPHLYFIAEYSTAGPSTIEREMIELAVERRAE